MKTPKFWYKDSSTLKYILNPLTIFGFLEIILEKNIQFQKNLMYL